MKILWISHFLLYPEVGYGALQRSRNLLLELCKRHEVYLLSYYRAVDMQNISDINVAKLDLEQYCKKVILIKYSPDKYTYSKYIFMIKSIFSNIPYSIFLYRSKYLLRKTIDIVKTYHIDIVHADTMGLIEKSLDKIDAVKVLNHHNIESDMMFRRARKEKNIIKKLLFYKEAYQLTKYENKYCPVYDFNIMVSDTDNEKLKKRNRQIKTHVITNGVDCEYFKHHFRNANSKGLIFTGQLDWYPNLDAVLFFCKEVWPILKTRFDGLTFTIIGKNPPVELVSYIKTEQNIILKGFVPDIRGYIREAKVFICPIRDGGGTRLKILDALAQGIPTVSTSIGCEGIGLYNGNEILIANNKEDFVREICLLLSDISLCEKLSRNGRNLIEKKYSFHSLGKEINDLYIKINKRK